MTSPPTTAAGSFFVDTSHFFRLLPMSRLYLLDGMALAYRGHFALIRNPHLTSTGMNTSAPFVFANTLMGILANGDCTHIGCAFDTPEPTHRHKEFAPYKAQREAMPEDLHVALPYVRRICEALGVNVLTAPGWEADDIIGTLAQRAAADGIDTYMVTPDKDYGQLVTERIFVLKPGRAGSDEEVQGIAEINARWKIERPEQVIDILGLMGDASDNVPGVPGIGEKTAQKLIGQYGSVEGLLDHLDQLKGKQKETLATHREQALLSKRLVTIDCQVPVSVDVDDLKRAGYDESLLRQVFSELEFNVLGKRILGEDFEATATASQPAAGEVQNLQQVEHDYCLVQSKEQRGELVAQLTELPRFCFDLETTGLNPSTCEIIGLAFAFEAHVAYYVPLPVERDLSLEVLQEFVPLLSNPLTEKVGHNLKFDLTVLRWHEIFVEGPLFDTMIAAHLAEPESRKTMDFLAESLLGYRPLSITELIGEKGEEQLSMRDVELEQLVEYAGEDADITWQLAEYLREKLLEREVMKTLVEVESPLVSTLVEMEHEGVRLDPEPLTILSQTLSRAIDQCRAAIFQLAGEEFNLNSPQQLGTILFEKLKIDPNARRTRKTGQFQTNEQTLRRLAMSHEIAQQVLSYRESTKLKSTYVDMLPGTVDERTGHVHTTYEQAVTATGRLQSSGPNLQNIPVRSEFGREIRKAFVPRSPEYLLLSADYSQIELRLAAEISGDVGMQQTFKENGDIHATTAMKVYEVDEAGVTVEMRRRAKAVNFGIIYGISAFGLAGQLDISRGEAKEIIDQYFEQFPGIRSYMDETIDFAREHGYVATIMGRRRYLRDITSRNAASRAAAERNAINTRIQGSAADMIKIAMANIHREIKTQNLKSRMLLQVHDELVFDMHRSERELLPPMVEEKMRSALPVEVPIVVEVGIGTNWLEAH